MIASRTKRWTAGLVIGLAGLVGVASLEAQTAKAVKAAAGAPSSKIPTFSTSDLSRIGIYYAGGKYVKEGDKVSVGRLTANVIETPGHTSGHITYWFHADKLAFAGDTLFSIGCGRVIEGTPEMMWNSLLKLRDLPGDTRVYCGHEYTLANIKFAQTIEPDNKALQARAKQAAEQIATGKMTVPTTIDEEKAANVFLRADVPAVAAAVGRAGKPAAEVFTEVRARKNKF